MWLVATNHCRLEVIPCLSFFACCQQEDGVPAPADDCDTDGCATVESGFYKLEDAQALLPPMVPAILPTPRLTVELPALTTILFDASPPELPGTWQFSTRSAAPPRAPSIDS